MYVVHSAALKATILLLMIYKLETVNTSKFIKEADLLTALRPIQARKVLAAWKLRCQTPEASSSSDATSPGPPASLQPLSPRSSPSTSSNSCQSPDIDWVDTFMIPWDKFPEELMQSLEREKRPSPRMRREMIRIVVWRSTQRELHLECEALEGCHKHRSLPEVHTSIHTVSTTIHQCFSSAVTDALLAG
ncbi:unnamed protein product [Pleuronectes platessa]|uniref:Uncharacterized protein n=1 Tax=Pleuronectes platessa TaxID=8262 RepID=A0A9N7YNB8_PLEPL|nr:unnamed protein product [Pleuronectes platessa]